jgi:hypothetical protein
MIKVASSNLLAVDYNPQTRTLTIEFRSGHIYEYYNVPLNIFEGLLAAPSKGRFHHRYIKRYPYNRIR